LKRAATTKHAKDTKKWLFRLLVELQGFHIRKGFLGEPPLLKIPFLCEILVVVCRHGNGSLTRSRRAKTYATTQNSLLLQDIFTTDSTTVTMRRAILLHNALLNVFKRGIQRLSECCYTDILPCTPSMLFRLKDIPAESKFRALVIVWQ